jgi:hypothetical protein
LPIDARDNRRPLFDLPSKVSFQKAFEIDTPLLLEEQQLPFDETALFRQWCERGGHWEFLNSPFVPGSSRATIPNAMNIEWEFNQDESPAFVPLLKLDASGWWFLDCKCQQRAHLNCHLACQQTKCLANDDVVASVGCSECQAEHVLVGSGKFNVVV